MEDLTTLREAQNAGLRITVDGDKLVLRGPRPPDDLARRLLEAKPALLAILANHCKATYMGWKVALEEIADRWDIHAKNARARGQEPR